MMCTHRTALLLAAIAAAGCNSAAESSPDAPVNLPQVAMSLDAGAKVNIVEVDGDFAKVRSADGQEAYVLATLVQRRSMLDTSDELYTHVLSAATDAYESAPTKLPPPKPRLLHDIVVERLNVNQLYLTEKTHKEVIAPAKLLTPVDPETGEKCFPALTCYNPDCPGKSDATGERPYLFTTSAAHMKVQCPACARSHAPATRTLAERARYRAWIKPYRLPESAARLEQLEAESRTAHSQPPPE
ncbi:MAG: SH3 domain-containing protein [Pirellulales bacterium]|nr:SH3 domain-containing protein [Pirellulales bacterium]